MRGYSSTPLAQKLGIKKGRRIALPGIPTGVRASLRSAISGCTLSGNDRSALDFILLFSKNAAVLRRDLPRWAKRLQPAGMFWVAWPKKASQRTTDLDENRVRRTGLSAGLVDVKVCAIDDVWSGLKFVIRLKDRPRT